MSAFLTVALVHLLGVASPGPDFAIILKQSLTQSRRIVVWTACGVALGILVHVIYSMVGIGLLIAQSILLFSVIKFIGAGYLIFIGIQALRTRADHPVIDRNAKNPVIQKKWKAFQTGFLCNALNPKASLFFLAVFTQVITPETSFGTQLFYGVYMAFATFLWFSGLGWVLTTSWIRKRIHVIHLWAERVMGAVLIALGLQVALATRE